MKRCARGETPRAPMLAPARSPAPLAPLAHAHPSSAAQHARRLPHAAGRSARMSPQGAASTRQRSSMRASQRWRGAADARRSSVARSLPLYTRSSRPLSAAPMAVAPGVPMRLGRAGREGGGGRKGGPSGARSGRGTLTIARVRHTKTCRQTTNVECARPQCEGTSPRQTHSSSPKCPRLVVARRPAAPASYKTPRPSFPLYTKSLLPPALPPAGPAPVPRPPPPLGRAPDSSPQCGLLTRRWPRRWPRQRPGRAHTRSQQGAPPRYAP